MSPSTDTSLADAPGAQVACRRPPFDPELAAALKVARRLGEFSLITTENLGSVREAVAAATPDAATLERSGSIRIEEVAVPGPAGAPDVSLLVCRPAAHDGSAPGIYFLHGGGMVIGGNRTGVGPLLDWVERFGVVLVSVEYRVAPEHPEPKPQEDCWAGLLWTAAHAAQLGIDPERLIVAGSSAGGGLAAGLALRARDSGGPTIAGQILMSPMLDDRNVTRSSGIIDGGTWDRGSNDVCWDALLGDRRAGPDVSPYSAPARATDLSFLPSAFIDVGSAEPFRDEAAAYAARTWDDGGSAELHVWPGGFHGFDEFAPQAALSQVAIATRANWLQRLLSSLEGQQPMSTTSRRPPGRRRTNAASDGSRSSAACRDGG